MPYPGILIAQGGNISDILPNPCAFNRRCLIFPLQVLGSLLIKLNFLGSRPSLCIFPHHFAKSGNYGLSKCWGINIGLYLYHFNFWLKLFSKTGSKSLDTFPVIQVGAFFFNGKPAAQGMRNLTGPTALLSFPAYVAVIS